MQLFFDLLPTIWIAMLNMSITASIIILFVLLARLCLRHAPKGFSYALWAVVLFRLLCPISFELPIAALGITGTHPVAESQQSTMQYVSPQAWQGNATVSDVSNLTDDNTLETGTPMTPNTANSAPTPNTINPSTTAQTAPTDLATTESTGIFSARLRITASIIWLCGALLLLASNGVSLYRLKHRLHDATPYQSTTITTANMQSQASNRQSCPRIYASDTIPTAFVLGVLRPCIYLPTHLTDTEQTYILAHEQTHITRRDPLWQTLAFFALCLHWFNPLVWVAYKVAQKDMELSCDERVLRQMGGGIKKEYAQSLLNLSSGKTRAFHAVLAFGESSAKSRIKNVLSYRKPVFWVSAVACVALVITGILLLANPAPVQSSTSDTTDTSMPDTQSQVLATATATPTATATATPTLTSISYPTIAQTEITDYFLRRLASFIDQDVDDLSPEELTAQAEELFPASFVYPEVTLIQTDLDHDNLRELWLMVECYKSTKVFAVELQADATARVIADCSLWLYSAPDPVLYVSNVGANDVLYLQHTESHAMTTDTTTTEYFFTMRDRNSDIKQTALTSRASDGNNADEFYPSAYYGNTFDPETAITLEEYLAQRATILQDKTAYTASLTAVPDFTQPQVLTDAVTNAIATAPEPPKPFIEPHLPFSENENTPASTPASTPAPTPMETPTLSSSVDLTGFPTLEFDNENAFDSAFFWREITTCVAMLNECYTELFTVETTNANGTFMAAYQDEQAYTDDIFTPTILFPANERDTYASKYYLDPGEADYYPITNYQTIAQVNDVLLQYLSQDVIDSHHLNQSLCEYQGALYLIRGAKGYGAFTVDAETLTFIKQEGNLYHLQVKSLLFDEESGRVDLTFAYTDGHFILTDAVEVR